MSINVDTYIVHDTYAIMQYCVVLHNYIEKLKYIMTNAYMLYNIIILYYYYYECQELDFS